MRSELSSSFRRTLWKSWKIAGLALTGVLLASLMKSVHKEFSIYIILATVIVVFLMILDKLTEVFVFLQSIYDSVPYGKTFFPVIFKVLAVAYIADLTAQLCRDAGESAVGGKSGNWQGK